MENKHISIYKSEKSKVSLMEYYDAILKNFPIYFEEILIETKCGKTHIIVCGKEGGHPLFLFHGTGNNSLMWRYNIESFGKYFRLYLIDTINDPGKSQASTIFNPETDYSTWVEEILEKLKIEKVSLLGHSKGGWIALNTLINIPEKLDKVVLLAPAAGIYSTLNSKFIFKSLFVGIFPSEKNVNSYLKYISGPENIINVNYVKYLSKLIRGTKAKVIKHREFSDDELKNIDKPVLLLFGENEKCIDYQLVIKRAKSLIENLEAVVIPDAGHGLQGEKPEIVNKLIINFILGR